jgi:hypothetical protein
MGALRRLRRFDFLDGGVPQTGDARRHVGAAAIHTLLVSEAGRVISHDDSVVYAVLTFVQDVRGGQVPTRLRDSLSRVLARSPVTLAAVTQWFTTTFT